MTKGFKLSKFWYWFFSLTWGLSTTIIGLILALVLLVTGHTPDKNNYGYVFHIGENWGGINLGPVSLVSTGNYAAYSHEFGHSIQNCIFGPFFWVFVAIPSYIRYNWFRYKESIGQEDSLPVYDYAWFEQQATMFGKRYSS